MCSRRAKVVSVAVVAVLSALGQVAHGDTATRSSNGTFIIAPPPAGWIPVADEPPLGLPQLAPLHFRSPDGDVDVDIAALVLAFGHQKTDFPSGAIAATRWLPPGTNWVAVGPKSRRCYWRSAPVKYRLPQYRYSGQARCRGANFVLIFNFFSNADRRRSNTIWNSVFKKIVTGTTTSADCLMPEEMAFIADSEGPPFATQTVSADRVTVAALSMCGSGGCGCFQFHKRGRCFQLVLPRQRCNEDR